MTDEELKKLVASLAISQAKTDEELKKLVASLAISQAKTDEQIKATNKQIEATNKQIGGLHNKFGLYVEALAFPSIERILSHKFGTDSFSTRCKRSNKEGVLMEVDAIAFSNSRTNQVFMIEIKSLLNQDGLTQTLKNLKRFKQFFPEHKDKELFGVLVYTDTKPAGFEQKVLKHGLYLAHVSDDLFELQVSDTFQARSF